MIWLCILLYLLNGIIVGRAFYQALQKYEDDFEDEGMVVYIIGIPLLWPMFSVILFIVGIVDFDSPMYTFLRNPIRSTYGIVTKPLIWFIKF